VREYNSSNSLGDFSEQEDNPSGYLSCSSFSCLRACLFLPDRKLSSRFIASSPCSLSRWLYRRNIASVLCPVIFITTASLTPAFDMFVLNVCLRSWKRYGPTPASMHAFLYKRCMYHLGMGLPSGFVNTSSCSGLRFRAASTNTFLSSGTESKKMCRGSSVLVSSSLYEVLKSALVSNSTDIILAHNHPNGMPKPSLNDLNVTGSLMQAAKLVGITIVDHVIMGLNDYASLRELGFIEKWE